VIAQSVKVAEKSGGKPGTFPFDFTLEPVSTNEYIFTAFATDGKPTATTFVWDFGDGQTVTGGAVQTHQFAEAVKHTITLRAQGFAGSATHEIAAPRHRPARH